MDTVIWTETPERTAWWESILGIESGAAAQTTIETRRPAADGFTEHPRAPRLRGLSAA